MAKTQTLRLGLVLALATVVVAFAVVAMSVRAQAPEPPAAPPVLPTWPAFTMTYETDGIMYTVGSNPSVTTREVRRLDYVSATEWTDTVIEAPTITTSAGATTRVGSYVALDDSSFTESETGGETLTSTIEEDTTYIVGTMPPPFPFEALDLAMTETATTATVCFLEECTENASGLLYTEENGVQFVFVDDARGIPLRVGDGFTVRDIRIEDVRQAPKR